MIFENSILIMIFRFGNKLCITLIYTIKDCKIHISFIRHVNGQWYRFHNVKDIAIVPFAVSHMDEAGATLQIKKRMHLHRTFRIFAQSQCEQFYATRYGS